jgi:hypothetical protein
LWVNAREIIIGNPQLVALQLLSTHHPWVNAREIIIGNPQLVALQLLSTLERYQLWITDDDLSGVDPRVMSGE